MERIKADWSDPLAALAAVILMPAARWLDRVLRAAVVSLE